MSSTHSSRIDHVSDPVLQPFRVANFDPVKYLNETLPALLPPSNQPAFGTKQRSAASLSELSSQTQSLLSQLSAQTSRLTATLNQLTDEILRSGSRLAYEVEILRGDALGLSETLNDGLGEDIKVFLPEGLHVGEEGAERTESTPDGTSPERRHSSGVQLQTEGDGVDNETNNAAPAEPQFIKQLRTLSLVRERLDLVIKTFGEAMDWTIPPSEVSVASSFISVSAPEPGTDSHSREEKGQAISKQLRDEITAKLTSGKGIEAIEEAEKRVDELRLLASVWKGTAEEKARLRFVEGLAKLVEDKEKSLHKEQAGQAKRSAQALPERLISPRKQPGGSLVSESDQRAASYGFIEQLNRMRGGL